MNEIDELITVNRTVIDQANAWLHDYRRVETVARRIEARTTKEKAMQLDFSTWGPLTTLAVIGALIVLVGGAVSVALGHLTFEQYLNDLKPVAAALGLGAGIGRGVRLAPHPPTTTRRRRRTT